MSQHDPVIRKIPILRAGTILQTVCIADVEPKPISWLWPEKMERASAWPRDVRRDLALAARSSGLLPSAMARAHPASSAAGAARPSTAVRKRSPRSS